MEIPFTTDPKNHRVVINVPRPTNVAVGTGALYVTSLWAYNRRFLRIDGNGVAAGAFAAFALPASYAYARFFLDSAVHEASRMNNAREGRE